MKNTKKIFGSLAASLAISLAVGLTLLLSLTGCSESGYGSVSASDRNGQSETVSGATTIKAYLPGSDNKSLKKAALDGITTVATTYFDDDANNEIKVAWNEADEDGNYDEKIEIIADLDPSQPFWSASSRSATFELKTVNDDGEGTFEGELPRKGCGEDFSECRAYYPAPSPWGGNEDHTDSLKNILRVQEYASVEENLNMKSLYKYDYMYSAIDGMNGTTPTVNFKHMVALLDITIYFDGTNFADRIGLDDGQGHKYFVKYPSDIGFYDSEGPARAIIAVPPLTFAKGSDISVFIWYGDDDPNESATYKKTITKEGGVSIEAGKYYALTFDRPRCGEYPYNPNIQWCNTCPNCDGGKVEDLLIDTRDGKTQKYKTVKIGTQTWMAENLNYETTNSWCYNSSADSCAKYGRLYTWSAAMDSAAQFAENAGTKCGYAAKCSPNTPHRGVCPEGWHVPTNDEYTKLYKAIGGVTTAGTHLKSTSGWKNSGNGTDNYGFSVLPAGHRYSAGGFNNVGDFAYLWSASEYVSRGAYGQYFYYDGAGVGQNYYGKDGGYSLRCLQDSN